VLLRTLEKMRMNDAVMNGGIIAACWAIEASLV
jgi:hypothetical protein